jgi:hypothetical protein
MRNEVKVFKPLVWKAHSDLIPFVNFFLIIAALKEITSPGYFISFIGQV